MYLRAHVIHEVRLDLGAIVALFTGKSFVIAVRSVVHAQMRLLRSLVSTAFPCALKRPVIVVRKREGLHHLSNWSRMCREYCKRVL